MNYILVSFFSTIHIFHTLAVAPEIPNSPEREQLYGIKKELERQSEGASHAINKRREILTRMKSIRADLKSLSGRSTGASTREVEGLGGTLEWITETAENTVTRLERLQKVSGELCNVIDGLGSGVNNVTLKDALSTASKRVEMNGHILKGLDDEYEILTGEVKRVESTLEELKKGSDHPIHVDDMDRDFTEGAMATWRPTDAPYNPSREPSQDELYNTFVSSKPIGTFKKRELKLVGETIERILRRLLQEASTKRTDLKDKGKEVLVHAREFLDIVEKIPRPLRTEQLRRMNAEVLKSKREIEELNKTIMAHIEKEERELGMHIKEVKTSVFALDVLNDQQNVPTNLQDACSEAFRAALVKARMSQEDRVVEDGLAEMMHVMENLETSLRTTMEGSDGVTGALGLPSRKRNGVATYGLPGALLFILSTQV